MSFGCSTGKFTTVTLNVIDPTDKCRNYTLQNFTTYLLLNFSIYPSCLVFVPSVLPPSPPMVFSPSNYPSPVFSPSFVPSPVLSPSDVPSPESFSPSFV